MPPTLAALFSFLLLQLSTAPPPLPPLPLLSGGLARRRRGGGRARQFLSLYIFVVALGAFFRRSMLPERRIRQLFWTGDLALDVDVGFTGEHVLGLVSSPFSFNKILPHCLMESHANIPTLVRLYFGDCGVDIGVSEVRSVGFPLSSSFFFFNKSPSLNRFKAVFLQILLACESLCRSSCSLALWLGWFESGPSHGCTLFF